MINKIKTNSASMLFLFVIYLMLTTSYPIFKNLGLSNISFYVITVCISVFLTWIFSITIKNANINPALFYVLVTISIVWMLLSFFLVRIKPQLWFDWAISKENTLYILFIILVQIVAFYLLIHNKGANSAYRIIVATIFSLICVITQFVPDEFVISYQERYHLNAYLTSIVNCTNYQPFSNFSKSIYGFYGIFFVVPVKALEKIFNINKYLGIMICIMFLTVIIVALYSLIISRITKNNGIYTLGLLSLSTYFFDFYKNETYFQIFPHRILFPMITIFSILYVNKKNAKEWLLIVIASLSLIWNFETGVICTFITYLFVFIRQLVIADKNPISSFIHTLKYLFLPFVFFCLMVNAYNLITGGNILRFKDLIFPMMSPEYNVIGMLELELPSILNSWFGLSLLPLVIIIFFVISNEKIQIITDERKLALCVSSLFMLLTLTYYMNRAVTGNLNISYLYVFIIMVFLLDTLFKENLTKYNKLFLLIPLFYFSVWTTPIYLESKNRIYVVVQRLIQHNNETKYIINEINECLVEGTAGIGLNIPELYAAMNRDTKVYLIDFADIDNLYGSDEKIEEEMLKYDYLLISKDTYEKYSHLIHHGNFREFGNENLKYYYCVYEDWR